jgi:hypothetical protein
MFFDRISMARGGCLLLVLGRLSVQPEPGQHLAQFDLSGPEDASGLREYEPDAFTFFPLRLLVWR